MKSKEEIEQLAEKYYPSYPDGIITDEIKTLREGFIKGYRCQKDMADKKYTEEDMLKCWNACLDFNKPAGLDNAINYRDFINLINDGQD